MVARRFLLRHDADEFPLDYDTDDGLEVLKFQIFSLTSIPPDEQQILVEGGNLLLTEASDLAAVSDQLRLLSVQEAPEAPVVASGELGMSDEELARLLQRRRRCTCSGSVPVEAGWNLSRGCERMFPRFFCMKTQFGKRQPERLFQWTRSRRRHWFHWPRMA